MLIQLIRKTLILLLKLTYRKRRMQRIEIKLTQGKVAYVSPEDFERVSAYKWHVSNHATPRKTPKLYARTSCGGKKRFMHRFIMNPPDGMVVDHIDGDGLNNTRENLRITTVEDNAGRVLRERKNIECFL